MVADFNWSVHKSAGHYGLVADPISADVDPLHCSVMEKMVDIYNRANKLSSWMAESPWFALQTEPAVLETLRSARANAHKIKKFTELLHDGKEEQLLIDSFLGSRVFNLAEKHRLAAGHSDADAGGQTILPVIDYCNHRFSAKGFSVKDNVEPPCMRVIGKPEVDTGEIYVRYNHIDAVDAYLSYGFVDTKSPYLGSKPTTLLVEGSELSILGAGGVAKRTLPPQLRDLRFFMPQIRRHEADNSLTLNRLLFPSVVAPRALQRVLAAILKSLGVERVKIGAAVAAAENQLIEENEGYWQDLRRIANHLGELHPVNVLCNHCIRHIDQYKRIRPAIS
jgi:hypothetical protein